MARRHIQMFYLFNNWNYCIWVTGTFVSNTGTWMQAVAQDWLVLTQLSSKSSVALGIVMALQFGPQLLLMPFSGLAADRFEKKTLLLITQSAMAVIALGLGILILGGQLRLWQMYIFAGALGCISAFDMPARLTIISELVHEKDLHKAIALNSTAFSLARMLGPAMAGFLIMRLGAGPVFLLNAGSFVATIVSLSLIRTKMADSARNRTVPKSKLSDGIAEVFSRPELRALGFMVLIVSTFSTAFPIFLSTMSLKVFDGTASQYGLFTVVVGTGSIVGALFAAVNSKAGPMNLSHTAIALGVTLACAGFAPNSWLYSLALFGVGAAAQIFNTASTSAVQLLTDRTLRGRVMAVGIAATWGGMSVGALIIGHMVNYLGPRGAMEFGAAAAFVAAGIGLMYFPQTLMIDR